jgi:hypothetical protein
VKGDDGQEFLELRLAAFVLVLGQLTTAVSLQGIFYLGTYLCYLWRIECLVQELGCTGPNFTFDVFCYSKHFFDL